MGNLFLYSKEMASRILDCASPKPGFIPPIRSFERFRGRTKYEPVVKGDTNGSKSISQGSVH